MNVELKTSDVRLSVAMCTHNGSRYLREQLNSIAAQSRRPDELVVCDDRSVDDTRDIIQEFASAATFPVQLFVSDDQLGFVKNFEKAVGLCRGEIIALCDQDDVWSRLKLERMAAAFESSPDLGLVFSDAQLVDENLKPLPYQLLDLTLDRRARRLMEKGKAFEALLQKNFVTGATMAFRSGFVDLILPIPVSSSQNILHDGWIALTIASAAEIKLIREPLIKYRRHDSQQVGVGLPDQVRQRLVFPRPNDQKESPEELIKVASYYQKTEYFLRELRQRLVSAEDPYRVERERILAVEARIAQLERMSSHLRARAGNGFPKKRIRRVPFVLRELLTLRYSRYSRGVLSAAKDLLVF